jgi:hypothetical protein
MLKLTVMLLPLMALACGSDDALPDVAPSDGSTLESIPFSFSNDDERALLNWPSALGGDDRIAGYWIRKQFTSALKDQPVLIEIKGKMPIYDLDQPPSGFGYVFNGIFFRMQSGTCDIVLASGYGIFGSNFGTGTGNPVHMILGKPHPTAPPPGGLLIGNLAALRPLGYAFSGNNPEYHAMQALPTSPPGGGAPTYFKVRISIDGPDKSIVKFENRLGDAALQKSGQMDLNDTCWSQYVNDTPASGLMSMGYLSVVSQPGSTSSSWTSDADLRVQVGNSVANPTFILGYGAGDTDVAIASGSGSTEYFQFFNYPNPVSQGNWTYDQLSLSSSLNADPDCYNELIFNDLSGIQTMGRGDEAAGCP